MCCQFRVLGLDEQTHRYFNVETQNAMAAMSDAAMYVNGFSVDKNGQVQLPQVGKVKLQGLTVGEAQDLLQRRINEYFTTATVILKMVNWRVSVLSGFASGHLHGVQQPAHPHGRVGHSGWSA